MMAKMKRKWIWVTAGVLVFVGSFIVARGLESEAAAADAGDTAFVFVGDLAESVSASGRILAAREADLSLTTSGVVDKVFVDAGDSVNAGDVLVRLDTAALERTVASAQLDLAAAQAELADLLSGPTAQDLAAVEAAVTSAQARLDDLLNGPSEQEIAASLAGVQAAEARLNAAKADLSATYDVSEADIMAAEADLESAIEQQEAAHNIWVLLADCEENPAGGHTCTATESDRMATATQNVQAANAQVALAQARLEELRSPDGNSIAAAQASLAAAEAQYDGAVARHEVLLLGPSDAEIASARADLASAQASLENLIKGPSETDIAMYEIRVAQAETAWQEAHNALDEASLVAPFDGTITEVYVSEGEQASGPAVVLVDDDSLELVLSVDQVDLGSLAVGQPAMVTLESLPDVETPGVITAIAPSASDTVSGLVTYKVHLELGDTDLPLLIGLTADADLVTARREDVLLVPNAAITADRKAGTYTVSLVHTEADGTRAVTLVEVTVGLKDSEHTQIIDGLVEGDEVLLGQLSTSTQQDFRPGQNAISR